LGKYFANTRLFLACLLAVLCALLLLGDAESFATYAIGCCVFTTAFGAGIPFAVAEVAELDVDGRYAVLTVSAIGLGAMIGPGTAGVAYILWAYIFKRLLSPGPLPEIEADADAITRIPGQFAQVWLYFVQQPGGKQDYATRYGLEEYFRPVFGAQPTGFTNTGSQHLGLGPRIRKVDTPAIGGRLYIVDATPNNTRVHMHSIEGMPGAYIDPHIIDLGLQCGVVFQIVKGLLGGLQDRLHQGTELRAAVDIVLAVPGASLLYVGTVKAHLILLAHLADQVKKLCIQRPGIGEVFEKDQRGEIGLPLQHPCLRIALTHCYR
jgi:hypothetical protein